MHAGNAVTTAEHASRPRKVAVPFKAPDPPVPQGRKNSGEQQEQSSQLSTPDSTAAGGQAARSWATAAAAMAKAVQHGLPPKPRPHTDKKGGMLHCC